MTVDGRVYLKVSEWCALTGEKPAAVQARLRRGTLRGRKFGQWRVLASELAKRQARHG